MKAIGYARVSTSDQADSGLSLTFQENKIRAYCEALDIELLEVKIDAGFSAKSLNRPAMQEVIAMIKSAKADAVVVLKLDRLTRSVKDLGFITEFFEKTGAALISVQDSINTTTASGRFCLNILGSISQWERESIGERTQAAMSIKKAAGQRVGTIPYGYELGSDGVTLEPIPAEQEALKLMRELRAAGLSFAKIAHELEKRFIYTKRGSNKWQPKTIYNLCHTIDE